MDQAISNTQQTDSKKGIRIVAALVIIVILAILAGAYFASIRPQMPMLSSQDARDIRLIRSNMNIATEGLQEQNF